MNKKLSNALIALALLLGAGASPAFAEELPPADNGQAPAEETQLTSSEETTSTLPLALEISEIPENLVPSTTVSVRIEGKTETILPKTAVTFDGCTYEAETSTLYLYDTPVAYCALKQASSEHSIAIDISYGPYGMGIESIAGEQTDWTNAPFWLYAIEEQPGFAASIDLQEVMTGDSLVFYSSDFSFPPLSTLTVSTTGTPTTTVLEGWYWDTSANTYLPLTPGSTVTIDGTPVVVSASGTIAYEGTPGSHTAQITDTSYIRSEMRTFDIASSASSSTASTTSTPANSTGGTDSGGGSSLPPNLSPSAQEKTETIEALLDYLVSKQQADGSIIDGGTTDWLLMSFAAHGIDPRTITSSEGVSLLDYARSYTFDGATDVNVCAGYPRHILGLLSAGIAPTDVSITSLKSSMTTACHTNNIYGQTGINDDVFALIALLETGTEHTDPLVTNIVNTILADQTDTGAFTWVGWEGADITGAAINTLVHAKQNGVSIEQSVLDNAVNYLKDTQLPDGGWGYETADILTTSWAVMGISALGQTDTNWLTQHGYSPWNPLVSSLNDEGYYEASYAPGSIDWFAMKHAVPALLGTAWPIRGSFQTTPTPTSSSTESGGGNSSNGGSGSTDTPIVTPTTTSSIDIGVTPTTTQATAPVNTSTPETIPSAPFPTQPIPDAIGGGSDDVVPQDVAGIRITNDTADTANTEQQSPSYDSLTQEETDVMIQDTPSREPGGKFNVALGITILLALLLGWRFIRRLV